MGTDRVAYSFRHTYATFRLMEGVDVYFLARQIGTSVSMIEQHYGHITPGRNAGLILQGVPGWEPVAQDVSGKQANDSSEPEVGGRRHETVRLRQ